MSYKLYWSPNTGSFAPEVLLEEAGTPYERVLVDTRKGDQRKPAFLAVNPMGRVPALALPDGTIMTESAAITLYIGERHPEAGLVPGAGDPDRPRFLRWLFFMACNLYEADLRLYHTDRYSTDPGAVVGIHAAALRDLDAQWALIEATLEPGPFLLGARYSALDPYMLMLANWYEPMDELLARFPRLRRACELVRARPAVAKVWARHEA